MNDLEAGGPDGAYRVLVVDDDETLLALIGLAFAKQGMEVLTATTAEEGIALLPTAAPDLVITDILLPDLSGWEVVRRIREVSAVQLLVLSGRDSDVDKARGLDLGADGYMTKPFSLLELEARTRALLRRSRRPDAGSQPTAAAWSPAHNGFPGAENGAPAGRDTLGARGGAGEGGHR